MNIVPIIILILMCSILLGPGFLLLLGKLLSTKLEKRMKSFYCWMGWHSHSYFRGDGGFESTGFDGASTHAKCRWCGYEGMIDSQGNLF